jgi:divinyl protochlorophyllide a 8-vinyl-reductase
LSAAPIGSEEPACDEPETDAGEAIARIGPNAITRVAEALRASHADVEGVFSAAGLGAYLRSPPIEMVDERDVIVLQQTLRRMLTRAESTAVNHDAGLRTGDYLLAHRIPKPAQRVLRLLPARPSSRILLKAVGQHSWTFSGSGDFSYRLGNPVRVRIQDCPICRGADTDWPVCDFYAGTFERLFRTLVHRHTRVRETECQAQGAPACVFEMAW